MGKAKGNEEYLKIVRSIYGDKYDLPKFQVGKGGVLGNVCLICHEHDKEGNEHGEFYVNLRALIEHHNSLEKCPKCIEERKQEKLANAKPKRIPSPIAGIKTTDAFVAKATEIHGNKYDYSLTKVEETKSDDKLQIVCPKHGLFLQRKYDHLNGKGCPLCGRDKVKLKLSYFIERGREVHGDKYDYSKVDLNNRTEDGKVCIICHEVDKFGREHGEFWQTPANHTNGFGCPKCSGRVNMGKDEFIFRTKQIHGDKYDYSLVEYVNGQKPIKLICPEHGVFTIKPNSLLAGNGCSKCSGNYHPSTEEWIESAKKVHGDLYDYSRVVYTMNKVKVEIGCKKHGWFWQVPKLHLSGSGCPICRTSKLEKKIEELLGQEGVIFEAQKKFDWLGNQSLDFYIPSCNTAIECHGIQHFDCSSFWTNSLKPQEALEKIESLDDRKNNLCREHGIDILYYTEQNVKEYRYTLYKDTNKLLSELQKRLKTIQKE